MTTIARGCTFILHAHTNTRTLLGCRYIVVVVSRRRTIVVLLRSPSTSSPSGGGGHKWVYVYNRRGGRRD